MTMPGCHKERCVSMFIGTRQEVIQTQAGGVDVVKGLEFVHVW